MYDAALDAMRFIEGRSRAGLKHDRMLAFALVKAIEIVGEAAFRLTPGSHADLPGIPWTEIIAMRHRLVHAYYDIDLDRVWDTLTDGLPPLIEVLASLINGPRMPGSSS